MLITHLDCLGLAHWLHNTAAEDNLGPLAFAITDTHGDLIWFERMDQALALYATTAIAKAYTSTRVGTTTLAFKQELEKNGLKDQDYIDQNLTAIPGGSPLYSANGAMVGAIGISSRHLENDQALADASAYYFSSI